jgi:hypothetical protein
VIRVKKITSVKGNKAELFVSTRSDTMSNAYGKMEKFPYSTADVEMLCEGSYWKFKSYNDNNISYKQEQ